MTPKKERDIEKGYTTRQMVDKLRRLADCLEQDKPFRIQIAGERINIPSKAKFNIEHEKEGNHEEIEFQFKWQLKTDLIDTVKHSTPPEVTPGAKMLYLIKRKPTTSREELVAHWFANHMPQVIQRQKDQAAQGSPHARRYIVTLYDANEKFEHPWDGMAQLWWDKPLPRPEHAFGTTPSDTFQQKVEPYFPWASTEYVVMDGLEYLKVEPLTLNAPFPCTRSGFYKVSFLVKAKKGADFDKFYAHWLNTHVPNVRSTMEAAEGFRYVVSHSIHPQDEPYAGLAELYFHDETGWTKYKETIKPDGMAEWTDREGTLVLGGRTEMIGLP